MVEEWWRERGGEGEREGGREGGREGDGGKGAVGGKENGTCFFYAQFHSLSLTSHSPFLLRESEREADRWTRERGREREWDGWTDG